MQMCAGNITLVAEGSTLLDILTLNANVTATGGTGAIILAGGNNVDIAQGVTVSAAGTGSVTVAAGEDYADETFDQDGNAAGSITMGPAGSANGTINTEDGNIRLDAANAVQVGVLNADSDNDSILGNATVYARRGAITDGNSNTLNITANELEIQADDGIGASGNGNRLDTNVNSLEAVAGDPFALGTGGTGGVFVDNQGDLVIGGVSGAITGVSATGDIEVL